jgi:Ca2+-binding RTX toxin-like protein
MSTSNKAVDTTAGSSLRHPGDDARLPPDIGPGSTDVVVPMPGGGNGVNASRLASASFSPVTDGGSNPSVQNLLWGYKWGGTVMGQPVTLSYSLATVSSVYNYADNSNDAGGSRLPLNALQASAVVSTLAAYSAVARLSFNALTDNALQAGDLRYGNTDSPVVGTAYAYLPYYEALGGDVWFGDVFDYQNPVVGDYGYATFLHETGHALGLTHPHDADVAAVPGEDQLKYSVMSYRSYDGAPLTGYTGSAYPTSLMINDIQALQFLYGANTSHHAGNDTYSWLSGQVVFETLWDGGGIDTLDATSQAQGTVLYLTPGKWSQIGVPFFNGQSNVRDTLTIAYGAVIENAIGSAFADTLEGNAAGNVLSGGDGSDSLLGLGGNDTLDGGGGADRLVPGGGTDVVVGGAAGDTVELSGNLSAFTVSLVNATTLNLVSAAHNVTVSEVESFQFADGTRTLAQVLALATSVPTTGNDLLQGDDGDNLIDGLAGNDTLLGLGGNDTLIGGPGTDSLVGGPGDDVYRVDVATDVLLEEAAAGDDRVEVGLTAAGSTFIVPSNVEQAVITSTAAVHLTGPSTGARLVGNAAANRLNGGKGNDTLDGGAGIDTLVGNGGNDVYRLNLTTDVVTEPGATDFDWDGVELNLATAGSYTLPAGVEWLAVTHMRPRWRVSVTGNGLIERHRRRRRQRHRCWAARADDVLATGTTGNDSLDGGRRHRTWPTTGTPLPRWRCQPGHRRGHRRWPATTPW